MDLHDALGRKVDDALGAAATRLASLDYDGLIDEIIIEKNARIAELVEALNQSRKALEDALGGVVDDKGHLKRIETLEAQLYASRQEVQSLREQLHAASLPHAADARRT